MISGRPTGQLVAQSTMHTSVICSRCLPLQIRTLSTSSQQLAPEEGSAPNKTWKWKGPEVVEMYKWLQGPGARFKQAMPGSTNYLTSQSRRNRKDDESGNAIFTEKRQKDDEEEFVEAKKRRIVRGRVSNVPFRHNPFFKSEPVLSEELKEAIYLRVMNEQKSVREASEHFGVSTERVAAVVRMKQIERNRLKEGKPLAPFLNKAVLDMLPQTKYNPNVVNHKTHESINDVPVISATANQLFWPTSESRYFTRIDAGKAFRGDLLPVDMRIPHPQMVKKHRVESNMSRAARMSDQAQLMVKVPQKKEPKIQVIAGPAWDLRVEDVNVETTGLNGRSRQGIGYRYGMPHEDRKRGQVKIPTSVE